MKLIQKGHGDLYQNGALQIPHTKVKVIPPGPKTAEFAASLIGINARDSFLMALDNALSTTKLIKAGTLKTLGAAKRIHTMTGEIVNTIDEKVSEETLYLVDSSIELPKQAWVESLEIAGDMKQEILDIEKRMRKISIEYGEEVRVAMVSGSKQIFHDWKRELNLMSSNLQEGVREYDKRVVTASRKRFIDWWEAGGHGREQVLEAGKKVDSFLSGKGESLSQHGQISGRQTDQLLTQLGESFEAQTKSLGESFSQRLLQASENFNDWSEQKAKQHFQSSQNYIQGYIELPKKMAEIAKDQGKSFKYFSTAFSKSNDYRRSLNDKLSVVWNEYSQNAGNEIAKSFENAKNELTENSSSIGYTFGAVKSLSWLARLVFWDLLLKPFGNIALQAAGYLTVNGVIFPSMLVIGEAGATTIVATKLVMNLAEGTYEIVSPSVKASFASIFAFFEYTGGKVASGILMVPSKPIEYGLKLTGEVGGFGSQILGKLSGKLIQGTSLIGGVILKGSGKLLRAPSYILSPVPDLTLKTAAGVQSIGNEAQAKVVHGLGYIGSHILKWPGYGVAGIIAGGGIATGYAIEASSKFAGHTAAAGVRYIGVPALTLGVPASVASVGVLTGSVGAGIGATSYVTGKLAAGATLVFGNSLAAATTVVGVSTSAVTGAAVTAYEFGKALTVPAAYTLGSGIVMSYGMLVHLGAQSLLAVSDAAYLVLSLEGPRWVIYAVTGKLGKGKDLKPGTVLDLEKMQSHGEEFKVVPTSTDQMSAILE